MKRILALEYSQSGDVTRVADAFTRPLQRPDVEFQREFIHPTIPYPYPWKSIWRLFSVFPECFLGSASGIKPLALKPGERYDLVILAYQVWHLAPSIPVQDFLRSEAAGVLRDTPVITLCVGRNMWHSAAETMKRLLRTAGAIHIDNVVVKHQGPPFSTFVSVPRALLFGKKDGLWGIFPPADLSAKDLERAERLGSTVADRLGELQPPYHPLLAGLGAVEINRRYIAPEWLGWHLYRGSARLIAGLGGPESRMRRVGISLFVCLMVVVILLFIPLTIIAMLVFYPLLRGRINCYVQRLAEPSGERVATAQTTP